MSNRAEITIKSDNEEIDSIFEIRSLEVIREVNRIPYASIEIVDGDPAKGTFRATSASTFYPGKEIEIIIEDADDSTQFRGYIVRQEVEIEKQQTILYLEVKDAAYQLTRKRVSGIYREQSDEAIIAKVVKDAGYTPSPNVEPSGGYDHAEMIQHYATPWDFILSRADANGWLLTTNLGQMKIVDTPLDFEAEKPILTLDFNGEHVIYSYKSEINISEYYDSASASVVNISDQSEVTEVAPSAPPLRDILNSSEITEPIGGEEYILQSLVPIPAPEAKAWAEAKVKKSRLSMILGKVSLNGIGTVLPGDLIRMEGFADLHDGNVMVTYVCHKFVRGEWVTDLNFGLSSDWYHDDFKVNDTPAGGLTPAIQGLHIGVVDQYEKDDTNELRVKVKIFAFKENDAVWARLSTPAGGNSHGFFYRPEPGDEVVVGFYNNDPRCAVILSSLYGTANAPPLTVEEENQEKGIITKEGSKVVFNDEDKSIMVSTENLQVVIDEKEKCIILNDSVNKGSVKLSQSGIEISTEKDFSLSVKGNVDIKADGEITLKGQKIDVI